MVTSAIIMPMRVPLCARSRLPWPRFWPTNVVAASDMDCIGSTMNWSILLYAVQPDMQSAPNTLI